MLGGLQPCERCAEATESGYRLESALFVYARSALPPVQVFLSSTLHELHAARKKVDSGCYRQKRRQRVQRALVSFLTL